MKPNSICLFALVTLLLVAGCEHESVGSAGSSVGTYVQYMGELRADQNNGMDALYIAVENGVDDLGYKVTEHTKDPLESRVVCEDATGKKIKIVMENTNPNRIELRIHVGAKGDEKQSIAILEKIRSHL